MAESFEEYDFEMPLPQQAIDVARRCLILFQFVFISCRDLKPSDAFDFLKKNKLLDFLTNGERGFLQSESLSKSDINSLSWEICSLKSLLWSLGKIRSNRYHYGVNKALEQFNAINEAGVIDWIESSKLRSISQIEKEEFRVASIHWSMRDADSKGKENETGFHPLEVYQTHKGLCWALDSSEDWDNVAVST